MCYLVIIADDEGFTRHVILPLDLRRVVVKVVDPSGARMDTPR